MQPRWWLLLVAVTLAVTACGVLPGTGGADTSSLSKPTPTSSSGTPVEAPTATAIPVPTERPTPTGRPTATPLPTPTPTPAVTDAYTTSLTDFRAAFNGDDPEAAIGAMVPLPFELPFPPDASMERLEMVYGRWDFEESITGQFPAVDTAASVRVAAAYQTDDDVDALRARYDEIIRAQGYVVTTDQSEEGKFADTQYELNGGFTQARGLDGDARVAIFRQGERWFVQVEFSAELSNDSQPSILNWPTDFVIPLSGGFTFVTIDGIRSAEGVQVVSEAVWTFGVQTTDTGATLTTLMDEYPVANITLGETTVGAPDSAAVVEVTHPSGSEGVLAVRLDRTWTSIEIDLASLPG